MSILSWWKSQSVPPSNEDIHIGIYAPYIREHLSKNNISSLTESNLHKIFSYTYATMDHVIKMSAETFGLSAKTSLNKEETCHFIHKVDHGSDQSKRYDY